jgi:hypothetical protein
VNVVRKRPGRRASNVKLKGTSVSVDWSEIEASGCCDIFPVSGSDDGAMRT